MQFMLICPSELCQRNTDCFEHFIFNLPNIFTVKPLYCAFGQFQLLQAFSFISKHRFFK